MTIVITIDGPAGAGKSTVAKRLSKVLNYAYLDTGAMYRAVTLKALRLNIDLENEQQLVDLAANTSIDLKNSEDGVQVFLDGEDVSRDIRSVEVTNNTFYAARTKGVREIMVQWQRAIGSKRDIVVEGRDVGTVVFPNATKKFFLDANLLERSRRRGDELKTKGVNVNEKAVAKDLAERDQRDQNRDVGPLKQAEDAVYIDSTKYTIDQVVTKMLKHIHG